jgi:predicted RNA binding protein YcfA (HicA-like mRNA interferase family)
VKYSEFRKWLQQRGATFVPAKGSHWKVTLNGKTTIFPIMAPRKSVRAFGRKDQERFGIEIIGG